MSRAAIIRSFLAVLLLVGLPWMAQGQGSLGVSCPDGFAYQCTGLSCACVATEARYGGKNTTDPLNLLWDLAGGTASQAAAAQTELLILITPRTVTESGAVSTCVASATVEFHDASGSLLGRHDLTLSGFAPAVVIPAPVNGFEPRKRFQISGGGTASGCAVDELPTVRLRTADDTGAIADERLLTPRLTFDPDGLPAIVPAHVFPSAARGLATVLSRPCPADYAYQCTGLSCACVATQALYGGKNTTDPLDLLWDLAGGTSSQAGETVEAVLGFHPAPASSCHIGVVLRHDLSPDAPFGSSAGSDDQELALGVGAGRLAVAEWANAGSTQPRRDTRLRVRGRATGCLPTEINGLGMVVSTYDTATGRTTSTRSAGRPLVFLAEDVEGTPTGGAPLPIVPAYVFPPGYRLGGSQ
jgi:hypothetical protein